MNLIKSTIWAAGAVLLTAAGAAAQSDYYSVSAFEGLYLGATAGVDVGTATNGTLGAAAGVNMAVTDGFVVGAEVQGGLNFGTTQSYDALMLGRVGFEVDDATLIYGAAGAGTLAGTGSYALGGGAEMIITGPMGVRGEILGTGAWGGGIDSAKATAGLIWHVQ